MESIPRPEVVEIDVGTHARRWRTVARTRPGMHDYVEAGQLAAGGWFARFLPASGDDEGVACSVWREAADTAAGWMASGEWIETTAAYHADEDATGRQHTLPMPGEHPPPLPGPVPIALGSGSPPRPAPANHRTSRPDQE